MQAFIVLSTEVFYFFVGTAFLKNQFLARYTLRLELGIVSNQTGFNLLCGSYIGSITPTCHIKKFQNMYRYFTINLFRSIFQSSNLKAQSVHISLCVLYIYRRAQTYTYTEVQLSHFIRNNKPAAAVRSHSVNLSQNKNRRRIGTLYHSSCASFTFIKTVMVEKKSICGIIYCWRSCTVI